MAVVGIDDSSLKWSGLAAACVSARMSVEWRVGCGGWWVVSSCD